MVELIEPLEKLVQSNWMLVQETSPEDKLLVGKAVGKFHIGPGEGSKDLELAYADIIIGLTGPYRASLARVSSSHVEMCLSGIEETTGSGTKCVFYLTHESFPTNIDYSEVPIQDYKSRINV